MELMVVVFVKVNKSERRRMLGSGEGLTLHKTPRVFSKFGHDEDFGLYKTTWIDRSLKFS